MKFDARKTLLTLLLVATASLAASAQEDTTTSDAAISNAATPEADAPAAATPAADAKAPSAPQDADDADKLPEFDQAEIIRGQLGRLEKIKQDLRLVLVTSESDHFILFSDLDTRVRRAILDWLEDLRTKLSDKFGLDAKARLWDGKCLVLVFARQEFLADFARKFDNHNAQRPRGYFVLESRTAKGPRLVHIAAYQPVNGGNEALQEVLVHETTHAIIELYQKSAEIPLWVHEGLAEYMTTLINPALRVKKAAEAHRVASATPYEPIRDLFNSRFSAANMAAYSISITLVECLQSIDAGGVMKLVTFIKQGVEPEAALGKAYPGLNYEELERRWQRFVLRNYRPPADADDAKR